MIQSTKVANILALGGGTIIFIVVAAITIYMTSEYNKAKKYEELEEKYNDTLLKLNRSVVENSDENPYEDCKLCQFPFIFQGKTYYDCISSSEIEEPWCPNMVDKNNTYIDGQKITCPSVQCSGCKF